MAANDSTPRTDAAPGVSPTGTPAEAGAASHRVAGAVFAGMLALAFVGMALTMMRDGSWEVWGVVLLVYGGVSVAWDWQKARERGEPVARIVRLQVLHWGLVLVGLAVLVLLERTDILSRQSASTVALLLLAIACLLAGVHFDWTFLVLGLVLTIMTVAVAYLEQYVVWLVMVPVLAAAGWVYLRLRARRDASP